MAAALAASALLPPAAAPRAQSDDKLEKVEILLDWKALPTCAGFYLARQKLWLNLNPPVSKV